MGRLKLYIDYFKHQIKKRREAKKPKPIDPEEIKEEIWQADFLEFKKEENSISQKVRFHEEVGDGYEAKFLQVAGKQFYSLALKRKHLYAWVVNNYYRYKDFFIDAEIELPAFDNKEDNSQNETTEQSELQNSAGSCAAGFLFRHISDKAFYALLISDCGWVRLDAVVNSTPIPILGWTKPLQKIQIANTSYDDNLYTTVKIKIICFATSITVLINDTWLGHFDSDIVQAAGKVAFSGQNWEKYSSVKFNLKKFKIVSNIELVEAEDTVANDPKNILPESYINLATTYYAMKQYVAAIYQIKQAWKLRVPVFQDYLLAGRIYFAQHLTEEAEDAFNKALDFEPENIEVIQELASVYYSAGQTKKLKTLLRKISAKQIKESLLLCTIKGHLLSEEAKYEDAAKMYAQAFKLDSTQGILKYNEAKELALAEKTDEAVAAYLKASKLFLSAEQYKDLADSINALEHIAGDNQEVWAVAGKFYYAIENFKAALTNFKKLCKAKTKDATIWYLYGLLLQNDKLDEQDYDGAIKAFKKAVKLAPETGLYAFRLAEALYLNGDDCNTEIDNAEKLAPDNAWVYNLKGLQAIDNEDYELAETSIQKARKILPDEIVILENYVEAMRMQGKLKECESLFDIEAGTADLAAERNRAKAFHIYANALFFDGEYDHADSWYQKAVKIRPFDAKLLTDKAENALQIGFLNEADDLLWRALDIEPSERIYRLLSVVATQKGDYARAEIILQKAMSELGGTDNLIEDLYRLYIQTNRQNEAEKLLAMKKR